MGLDVIKYLGCCFMGLDVIKYLGCYFMVLDVIKYLACLCRVGVVRLGFILIVWVVCNDGDVHVALAVRSNCESLNHIVYSLIYVYIVVYVVVY